MYLAILHKQKEALQATNQFLLGFFARVSYTANLTAQLIATFLYPPLFFLSMATIIYSVCGEGNGHSFRAKEVIDFLRKKGHEVHIFSYGKGYKNLSKDQRVHEIAGPHIYYYNNKALALPTAILNTFRLPWIILHNLPSIRQINRINPQVIISDFEPWLHYLAIFLRIPHIALDNQAALLSPAAACVPANNFYKLSSKLVVKLFEPFADYYLCPVFYNPFLTKQRGTAYTPAIIRKEIQQLKQLKNKNKKKIRTDAHILVYQTSSTNIAMLTELKKLKEQFIVYGFPKEGVTSNITFRTFNNTQFYDDLINAKAVICNGGLMLMSEALYLGKPVYSIPIQHQFEQVMNAHYLEKMQLGVMVKKFTSETFSAFLKKLTTYKKYISKLKFDNNQALFRQLKEIIEKQT